MTYDLRRLRTHGLIEKIAHTHRYQVTDYGLHTAMFLTRVHDRLLPTGLPSSPNGRKSLVEVRPADPQNPGTVRAAEGRSR